jgi:predicted Rossmann fold flavoprotein
MAKSVIIIGGGASGLMAAVTAAENGEKVTVLEQNEKPGKKLLATGNGKCNLTNLNLDADRYHSDDPAFVKRILERFSVRDTLDFFRSAGLLVRDRDGWVYPITDQSSSVLNVLLIRARHLGVKIKTNEKVTGINARTSEVSTETWKYSADRVIIACGSPASEVRGSCDDLMQFAGALGIRCSEFRPSLVPLRVRGTGTDKWAGTRVHARITIFVNGKEAASDTGEIQLTSGTVSGIPAFQVSGAVTDAVNHHDKVTAELDLMPDMQDTAALVDFFKERCRTAPYLNIQEILAGILNERLIPIFMLYLKKHGINAAGKPVEEIPEGERDKMISFLAYAIRHYPLEVTGTASVKQAQVCRGGVLTSELTDNLESRKYPGLYFCGEAVNIDGPCGGYNLQWGFSSGHIAGCAGVGE